MTRLSSAERIRERAAECRARAEHPILQADAAEWLEIADTWNSLANAMEATAYDEAKELGRRERQGFAGDWAGPVERRDHLDHGSPPK